MNRDSLISESLVDSISKANQSESRIKLVRALTENPLFGFIETLLLFHDFFWLQKMTLPSLLISILSKFEKTKKKLQLVHLFSKFDWKLITFNYFFWLKPQIMFSCQDYLQFRAKYNLPISSCNQNYSSSILCAHSPFVDRWAATFDDFLWR